VAGEPYGRVVRTFWTDPDIKPLRREEKELLLYFCTSPHATMVGVYHCPLEYAAKESGTPIGEVREQVTGVLASFLTYDFDTEEVFVHALAKHNIGDELALKGKNGKPDNRIKSVEKFVEAVHSQPLRRAFLLRYAKPYNLTTPIPKEEAPSKPLPSPSEAIAVAVAGTEHSSSSGSSSKNPAKSRVSESVERRSERRPVESPLNSIAGAVRQHWWQPDSKPPRDWDMGRELSIWKAELSDGLAPENGLKAIEGLRALADSGQIDWLERGAKLTSRALFHSHNGALRMYPQALNSYFAIGEKPPPGRRRGSMATVGEVVGSVARRT
jgi:hypothetical protein